MNEETIQTSVKEKSTKSEKVIPEFVEWSEKYFFGMVPKAQKQHIKYLQDIMRKQYANREKAKLKERLKKI